jgi:very-short-patch-repair endonuclease
VRARGPRGLQRGEIMSKDNGREKFVEKQKKQKTLEDYQRVLRKRATPSEKIFKVILGEICKIKETPFKFQHIFRKEVGGYIVDFWLPEYRLIFEIDGNHHQEDERQRAIDKERDEWFAVQKIDVVRYTNNEIKSAFLVMNYSRIRRSVINSIDGRIRKRQIEKISGRKKLELKCKKVIEGDQEITICPEITKGMIGKKGNVVIKPSKYKKRKVRKSRKEPPGTFAGSIIWKR